MENLAEIPRESLGRRVWRGIKVLFVIFVLAFAALVVYRMPIVEEREHRHELDAKYARSLLGILDVEGKNLPPVPDPESAKATVLGIDANKNRIRDDIELAIFEELPIVATTSSTGGAAYGDANFRLRAAELKYVKSIEFMLREVTDQDSYKIAMQQAHYAKMCILSTFLLMHDYDAEQATVAADNVLRALPLLVFDTEERLVALGEKTKFTAPVATSTKEWQCDIKYPG